MSSTAIPISSRRTIVAVAKVMRRTWDEGLRGRKFHYMVRLRCPTANLAEYNAAADRTWSKIAAAMGIAPVGGPA